MTIVMTTIISNHRIWIGVWCVTLKIKLSKNIHHKCAAKNNKPLLIVF